MRLVLHFVPFGKYSNRKIPVDNITDWILDFLFYLVDVLLLSYIYNLVGVLLNNDQKYLSERQKEISLPFFKSSIDYRYVTVNSGMSQRVRGYAVAYVSLNTINFHKTILDSVFIHEMMHVWQYQKYGAVYIYRALKAQQSKNAYDYGGLDHLYQGVIRGKSLIDFNFEQQAQIVQDAYDLRNRGGLLTSPMEDVIYDYYLDQIVYDNDVLTS